MEDAMEEIGLLDSLLIIIICQKVGCLQYLLDVPHISILDFM